MKKYFFFILAVVFVVSLYMPCESYAKKKGQPAVQASDVAKENAAERTERKEEGNKIKDKVKGKKKPGKKGATPTVPAPGVPGAAPAVPPTSPEPKK